MLLLATTAHAEGLPAAAYRCEHDAECVVVPLPCVTMVVNRKFLAEARKQPTEGCLGAITAVRPACVKRRCDVAGGLLGGPSPPDKLGHHFGGDPARFAKHWDDPARDAYQKPDEVIRLMGITPGMTVADVGSGTGYFLKRLAAAVGPKGRVLALDIEPGMVKYLEARVAREKLAGVSPRLVSPTDPKLAKGSVDRVLIVNTWHHIGARAAYALRLRDALRPGGKIVIVDFLLDSPEGPPASERLTAEQVAAELEQVGLRPTILVETLPRHFIVTGE